MNNNALLLLSITLYLSCNYLVVIFIALNSLASNRWGLVRLSRAAIFNKLIFLSAFKTVGQIALDYQTLQHATF